MQNVSVCIVTHRNDKRFVQLLQSLKRQESESFDFEVLLIDATENSGILPTAKQFLEGIDYRVICSENNLGFNRALAVQKAKGDLIAFVDSDCFCPPDWLTNFVSQFMNALEEHKGLAAIGCGSIFKSDSSSLELALEKMQTNFFGNFNSAQMKRSKSAKFVSHIPTTNILYKRECLLKVGNFSEKFPRVCEDLELSYRLRCLNYKLLFITDNLVEHFSASDLASWFSKMFLYGSGQVRVAFCHFGFWGYRNLLPLFFAFLMFSSLSLAIVSPWFILPLGSYLLATFILSFLQTIRSKKLSVHFLFTMYLTTHFAYSLGAWSELLSIKSVRFNYFKKIKLLSGN